MGGLHVGCRLKFSTFVGLKSQLIFLSLVGFAPRFVGSQ